MKSNVIKITPEIAAKFLERNKNNRPLKQKTINYYAHLMANGKWENTGQSMSITPDNDLLDGQHRLKAVIKSGFTITEQVVAYDVNKGTFPAYDTGKGRSGADTFAIEGINNGSTLSPAMAKFLLLSIGRQAENGAQTKEIYSTKDDYLQLYYKHGEKEWQELVKFSLKIKRSMKFYSTSVILSVLSFLIFEKKHPENKVLGFFNQLVALEPDQYTGTRVLREMLVNQAGTANEMKLKFKMIMMIKAWNSYISQQNISVLKHDAKKDKQPKFI